jgi:2-isopropylmalate synthase
MTRQVTLYDTTLRDGAQREGISFTLEDKLKVLRKLDELGIHFIEGGWPGSNPKDSEFFRRACNVKLASSTLTAFGSTHRADLKASRDPSLRALVDSGVSVATIFGKSWELHVTEVLEVSLSQNLDLVAESCAFLREQGLRVIFDAEHFFDGYKANAGYAMKVLQAAVDGGAECLVLCDTNGGNLPWFVSKAVRKVCQKWKIEVGIHAHNDSELAVANSLAAVEAGANHVQGTINGYGERCGNANLCSIIPDLKLKMNLKCMSSGNLAKLTEAAHYISSVANLALDRHLPFVGDSSFAHKGGMHVAALIKSSESYHHIKPDLVGNHHRVVVSELSGKGNILYKARERGISLPVKGEDARKLLADIKDLENRGFQYEDADASFELLMRRSQDDYKPPFQLIDFMVVVERHRRRPSRSEEGETLAEATVKVKVEDRIIHTAAEGNGPVNALDQALRKALVEYYPTVAAITLQDYKVRILSEASGTASQVRVLIECSDGERSWRTVGSSTNIIEASWLALADGLEYWLLDLTGHK